MKKLFIDTLGCQMNKSDTERIIGMLSHFGYEQTQDEYEADLFIVNTCAIRQLSVDKAYSLEELLALLLLSATVGLAIHLKGERGKRHDV